MNYPPSFISQDNFDSYCQCMENADIGDKVEVFTDNGVKQLTLNITLTTVGLNVVGYKYEKYGNSAYKVIVAGSKERYGQLYTVGDPVFNFGELKKFVIKPSQIVNYNYYYICYITDVRIARIIKQ